MNVNVVKLRKFKYRKSEPVVIETIPGNVGLKPLRNQRERTIERWKQMGLLDGLSGNIKGNAAKLFEGALSYKFP